MLLVLLNPDLDEVQVSEAMGSASIAVQLSWRLVTATSWLKDGMGDGTRGAFKTAS